MSPARIQRKRTKGWRMPEGAVYVGRPSRWGNPVGVGAAYITSPSLDPFVMPTFRDPGEYEHFRVVRCADAATAVAWYRPMAERWALVTWNLEVLRGRDLACWCALDQPCHADVLLELANR